MEYKIWVASYFISPPPYPTETPCEEIDSHACVWKTEETKWRHIGTVDSLEAARYMVENEESSYKDSEGFTYYLDCEPSDELFYSFAKIEYCNTIEVLRLLCSWEGNAVWKKGYKKLFLMSRNTQLFRL